MDGDIVTNNRSSQNKNKPADHSGRPRVWNWKACTAGEGHSKVNVSEPNALVLCTAFSADIQRLGYHLRMWAYRIY